MCTRAHTHTQTHTHQNYKFLKKGRQYLTGELLFNKNDESQKTMKVILNYWMGKKQQLATLFFYQKSRQNKGIFDKKQGILSQQNHTKINTKENSSGPRKIIV